MKKVFKVLKVVFIMGIKCFIASCGITFLLICFLKVEMPPNQKDLVVFVFETFIVLMLLLFLKDFISCKEYGSLADAEYVKAATGETVPERYAHELKRQLKRQKENEIKKAVRIHEAGHAVMAYLRGVENIEIDTASYEYPQTSTSYQTKTADDIKTIVLVKYSGAAAEEILLGKLCGGSMGGPNADFPMATEWIKAYIVMTDSTVSKSLLNEELSDRIIAVSNAFYQEAKDLLSKNKEMIEVLADELENKDTLNKYEIIQLFRQYRCAR